MPLRIPEAWHKHIHWVMILRGSWFSLHQNPRDLEQKGKEPKETYISWNESIWNLLNRVSSASQQFEEWHLKFCIWQFMEMMICVSLHINRKNVLVHNSLVDLTDCHYIAHSLRAHIDARVSLTSQKNGFMTLLPLFSCILPFCWSGLLHLKEWLNTYYQII